jgi:hypothetical protein
MDFSAIAAEGVRTDDQNSDAVGSEALSLNAQPMNLKVRTALRAGDVYMQYPRGSNNRLPDAP